MSAGTAGQDAASRDLLKGDGAQGSMRLLTVRHVTTYRYAEPVRFGEHHMLFRPREGHDLRLVSTRLEIRPRPRDLRWQHDVFDNSVAIATFADAAAELKFDSTVTLEQIETPQPDYALEVGAQTYPFSYPDEELPDLVGATFRRYPDAAVDRWAATFVAGPGPTGTMGLLHAITLGIKQQFEYVRRSEKGVQSPGETLQLGRGSCRDFALLMIEGVRSLGLAARFVSGYIFVPSSGRAATVGGGATHAWAQIYLPGAGWVDFDPTNSIIGNRNLIRVAVAWDAKQVLPLWGSFFGASSAFRGMEVEVSVTEGSAGSE